MKLLFYHRQSYTVARPAQEVQNRLLWIVNRRWEDYSMDLVGRMYNRGEFSLQSKWAWTSIQWIDNNPGRIQGRLIEDCDATKIHIITRPNQLLVGLFYFFLFLLGVELVTRETVIPLPYNVKIAFLAGVNFILVFLILVFRNGVKKRFEELMELA